MNQRAHVARQPCPSSLNPPQDTSHHLCTSDRTMNAPADPHHHAPLALSPPTLTPPQARLHQQAASTHHPTSNPSLPPSQLPPGSRQRKSPDLPYPEPPLPSPPSQPPGPCQNRQTLEGEPRRRSTGSSGPDDYRYGLTTSAYPTGSTESEERYRRTHPTSISYGNDHVGHVPCTNWATPKPGPPFQ